ncbi:MAG: glycine zipper domain-containing protein, partial [Desulfobacteraceae bacterium]|nr:glycine zipper domain-containing protein [Desulfobacteraceae bacterium]
LLGAAVGILSGRDIAKDTLKGAAVGAAGGALVGGAKGLTSDEASAQISKDLANKALKNKPIEPGTLARGFMFFPAEANGARQMRLQLRESDTGRTYTTTLIVN